MPVRIKTLKHCDDGLATALQPRGCQEVLTGLALLHSCNSQIRADCL